MDKLLVLMLLSGLFSNILYALPDEDHMTTPQIIKFNNYTFETHKVTTEDGYILTMFRIPYRHAKRDAGKVKGVFYLQHGFLGSSSNFVTNLPRRSLAFTLVDSGYDVWLGNLRGNSYSTEHQFLPVDSAKYWDFSHDEMAKYDLPSMVDHVLSTSGHKQLYYVGHSQGTLIAFGKMSEDEKFQQKIKGMFALAPVTQLAHAYKPLKILAGFSYSVKDYIDKLNITNPLPLIRNLTHVGFGIERLIRKAVCYLFPPFCKHNTNLTEVISEVDNALRVDVNRTDLVFSDHPLYMTIIPDGSSVKNFFHFAQLLTSGLFQKFDYNWFGNLIFYYSLQPPIYNVTNIRVPVVLFSGGKDIVSVNEDVQWLSKQLPNVLHNIVIADYDHLGFTWAKSAYAKVYKKIVWITTHSMK